jgi:flagellar biosynthetic protein FlhB
VAEGNTGQERTEVATPRKRQRAREQGNVARSMEISSVVVFAAGLLGLHFLGPDVVGNLAALVRMRLGAVAEAGITPDMIPALATEAGMAIAIAVLPIAGLVALAGITAQIVQVGPLVSLGPLRPRWERISPAAGLKRIFSKRALVELLKSLLKIAIVAGLIVGTLADAPHRLLDLATLEPAAAFAVIAGVLLKMAATACAALALLAILDFLFQRWDYEKQLMMTRQEVRQEHKETEGDPIVKSFIRSMQREVSRRRMMEGVKKADVVVTNPVHVAVALRYDPAKMGAPRVVAKGARLVAQRIREIARAAGVPIVEDPPLARALHKSCRVGAEIPLALYKAVADLLAFVYRARERRVAGGMGA